MIPSKGASLTRLINNRTRANPIHSGERAASHLANRAGHWLDRVGFTSDSEVHPLMRLYGYMGPGGAMFNMEGYISEMLGFPASVTTVG